MGSRRRGQSSKPTKVDMTVSRIWQLKKYRIENNNMASSEIYRNRPCWMLLKTCTIVIKIQCMKRSLLNRNTRCRSYVCRNEGTSYSKFFSTFLILLTFTVTRSIFWILQINTFFSTKRSIRFHLNHSFSHLLFPT